MKRSMVFALAFFALVVVTGCGDDEGGGAAAESTTTEQESGSTSTSEEAEDDDGGDGEVEVTSTVNPPDCASFEAAAAALVGPGSNVDAGDTVCQLYGQTSMTGAGTSWRIYVTGEPVSYPELDFEQATTSGFASSEGLVEAEAPEGWTVAATRTSEKPDPDFPEATSEQFLYFGGPGVAGLLRCSLELTAVGESGAAPPAAPPIDQGALVTFCDTAKAQMVVAAG